MMDREAYLAGYLAEVEEHLAAAGRNLLTAEEGLARGDKHPRAVRALFRSLHTIKGLSAMVGVDPAVDIAHGMEAVLRDAEAAGGALGPRVPDLLAQGLRALETCVAALSRGADVPPAPPALIAALGAAAHDSGRPVAAAPPSLPPELAAKLTPSETEQIAQGLAGGKSALQVEFAPGASHQAEGLSITTVREKVSEIGELVRVLPLSAPPSEAAPAGLRFVLVLLTDSEPEAVAAAAGLPAGAAQRLVAAHPPALPELPEEDELAAHGGRVVRVPVARLDDALERLSALVVTRSRLGRAAADLAARGVDVRELQTIVAESARQLRDLRAAIMRARMVSVSELLERVPLMVRGLTRATGKIVRLEIDAGQAELDKIGRRAGVPGDRPPRPQRRRPRARAARRAQAPRQARRGPGPRRVPRARAEPARAHRLRRRHRHRPRGGRQARRPPGARAPTRSCSICSRCPGVSTAARATTTSGRGMGVDIVRRIVARPRRRPRALARRRGAARASPLRVPLSITIVDAFAFETRRAVVRDPGRHRRGDPRRRRGGRITPAPGVGGLDVGLIERRGAAIPVVHLDAAFGLTRSTPPADGLPPKALVVRRGGAPVAFVVDRMLGQHEVVVRPVEDRAGPRRRRHRVDRSRRRQADAGRRPRRALRPPRRDARRASGTPAMSATAATSTGTGMANLHVLFHIGDAEYAVSAADVAADGVVRRRHAGPGRARVGGRPRADPRPRRAGRRSAPALRPGGAGSGARRPCHRRRAAGGRESRHRAPRRQPRARSRASSPTRSMPPPDLLVDRTGGLVRAVTRVGDRIVLVIDAARVIGEEWAHGR